MGGSLEQVLRSILLSAGRGSEQAAAMYAWMRLPADPLEDVVRNENLDPRKRLLAYETLSALEAPRLRQTGGVPETPRLSDARRGFACELAKQSRLLAPDSSTVTRVLAAVVAELREEARAGSKPAEVMLQDPTMLAATHWLETHGYIAR